MRKSIITAISALLISQYSSGQRVLPMVFELGSTGKKSSSSLHIENTRTKLMTVEFVANKLSLDRYGIETLTPAEDDFLIFPPQAIINPGKSQTVRVKYIGNPSIQQSQAYRISVKQLPIDMRKEGTSGVGMLINFNTLVNVTPKNGQALLNVKEINQGDQQWRLLIENQGNQFARLSETRWTISGRGVEKLTLNNQQSGALSDRNLIPPHSQITLFIDPIPGFDANHTKIDIEVPIN